jgi:type VII secretion protein EccB
MWTARDQLQAHQFLRRRLISALQSGDANHHQAPSRRLVFCVFAGVGIIALVGAGLAIWGVLRPGNSSAWDKPGQVIIEKESGATYVIGRDDLLHPVINYTSAMLLADGHSTAVTVSARSLSGAARGQPLGIQGAPTSLPAAGALMSSSEWTVCVYHPADRPSAAPPVTVLLAGAPPASGLPPAGEMVVVRDPAGNRYMVTGGRRLKLVGGAVGALGADTVPPVPVSQAWLNSVPVGPDLTLISVPGRGRPGPRVGGLATKVGEVLVATSVGGTDRYYVVRQNGLAAVSQTVAALVLGNPGTGSAVRVALSDAVAAPTADSPSSADYPELVPRSAAPPSNPVFCLDSGGGGVGRMWLGDTLPLPAGAHPVPVSGTGQGLPVADQVLVPPGSGALVRDQAAPGVATGTIYLITDQGVRYPLGGADVAKALGYDGITPVPVASAILTLFPLGPLLDAAGAQKVAVPVS